MATANREPPQEPRDKGRGKPIQINPDDDEAQGADETELVADDQRQDNQQQEDRPGRDSERVSQAEEVESDGEVDEDDDDDDDEDEEDGSGGRI